MPVRRESGAVAGDVPRTICLGGRSALTASASASLPSLFVRWRESEKLPISVSSIMSVVSKVS